jgi:release factor glutamine methyltransferase
MYRAMTTIRDLLLWGSEMLAISSSSASLDAELLLSHATRRSREYLLTRAEQRVGFFGRFRFRRLIGKRQQGIPLAYLTGHREFFMLDFRVNRHTLVPRPDTEVLAEAALVKAREAVERMGADRVLLIDIGTGSGCIPISILKHCPGVRAFATDLSASALRVARFNAARHGVSRRIRFFRADLFNEAVLRAIRALPVYPEVIIVTANLPYLPDRFSVDPSLKYEPAMALYGGDDGLEVYRRLMGKLDTLKPDWLFLECFEWQMAMLASDHADYTLAFTHPMTGEARLMALKKVLHDSCIVS